MCRNPWKPNPGRSMPRCFRARRSSLLTPLLYIGKPVGPRNSKWYGLLIAFIMSANMSLWRLAIRTGLTLIVRTLEGVLVGPKTFSRSGQLPSALRMTNLYLKVLSILMVLFFSSMSYHVKPPISPSRAPEYMAV